LNTDAGNTPGAFVGVAADARLEFGLAVRDPNCNATTGITRTATSVTEYAFPDEGMKSTAAGGHDPWPVDRYLNIWTVNYTDGTLGYGTFPAMPANIQGVVCDNRAFGTVGNLTPSYTLGRTATHEVGHWLNLNHIWGDDGLQCTGSDNVADTPNQAGNNLSCPAFPHITCSNGPNGDMFMNYMDYSPDACMNIFTAGQVARMDAALYTARSSILATDGLVPAASPTPDLWSKDVSDDTGAEPDASAQPMWISDDIWVRRQNDGFMNNDHQNPEYRIPGSPSNYVYVRVRNRGCSGRQSGTLKLYWAKASSGLSWPSPFDGSVTSPALMGGMIGSQPVSVAARDDEVLIFPWMPPNPANYASFGADRSHFCLLSRIETSTTAPYGMTFPEAGNLYANVRNNNNIVWKNITVVDELPGSGRFESVIVANFDQEIQQATIVFLVPGTEPVSIFDWGQLIFELPADLFRNWKDHGGESSGIQLLGGSQIRPLKSGATLGPIKLAPGDIHALQAQFIPGARTFGVRVYSLDLMQRTKERVIGGVRFILKSTPDARSIAMDSPSTWFDGVTWVSSHEDGSIGGVC
jgi:Pregnancy-associated plasma protein-A